MSNPASSLTIAPTVEEVRAICAIDNAIIRNLRVTDCYSRLSQAFAATRVGPGANWCTFATWASRQAGYTIRGEDLIARLKPTTPVLWRSLLRSGILDPRTPAGWIVRHVNTPFDAVERASSAVSTGNKKVFEEIGEVFARVLAEPDFEPTQPLLQEAFVHYRDASQTSDSVRRAWLLLFGNLKCGLHEQTRLQPEIEGAMQAPLQTVNDLTRRFLPFLRRPVARFTALVADLSCEIVTQGLMTLKLPDGTRLALGHDLDAPIPECFQGVETEPLLVQFNKAGHGGAGAENWADLQQRMRYIALLFRCYHAYTELFDPPFTPEQQVAMRSGQLPAGAL